MHDCTVKKEKTFRTKIEFSGPDYYGVVHQLMEIFGELLDPYPENDLTFQWITRRIVEEN